MRINFKFLTFSWLGTSSSLSDDEHYSCILLKWSGHQDEIYSQSVVEVYTLQGSKEPFSNNEFE